MRTVLEPWALLTATGALLAFLIGLYTLVGRERKSPYLINRVFRVFLVCLLGGGFDVLAALFPACRETFLYIGGGLLLLAFILTVTQVCRIAIRFTYFVDVVNLKHLGLVRAIRDQWRNMRSAPTYEHDPAPVPDEIKKQIVALLDRMARSAWEQREELDLRSLAIAVEHQGQANMLLANLAEVFLRNNYPVQYMTASRHPIEFVNFLKRHLEANGIAWQTVASRIVVVDAYSPHFAFIDSIYPRKSRAIRQLGVDCIRSKVSYAGMHTAASKAFNTIKAKESVEVRLPALVVYEDSYALTDLESPEQYRVFVRHVLPSERLWDGMFTVFVEAAQPDQDWNLLQSYASMKLDFRHKSPESRGRTTASGAAPAGEA
jgi:hypothetical protein